LNVSPLIGYKSYRAFQAFHTLMLGMQMLPAYKNIGYEKFYSAFSEMSEDEQEKMIKEAALFVNLESEEIAALISFCSDSNGIPYNETNLNNLKPDQFIECIVAVCMEIGKIKLDLLSNAEKKNLRTSPSMSVNN
jgi:hypothetical protein